MILGPLPPSQPTMESAMALDTPVFSSAMDIGSIAAKSTIVCQLMLLYAASMLRTQPVTTIRTAARSTDVTTAASLLVFFALVVVMAFLGDAKGNEANLSFSIINVLKLFGVGVITAATMVIPGVSGSMVLLLLGYYNPILSAITDFIKALTSFDMGGILTGIGILMPFGIGVIVGVLAIAKVIEYVFNKFPLYAYWAIIGLIVASPIAIIAMASLPALNVLNVATGLVALCIGVFVAMKLGD